VRTKDRLLITIDDDRIKNPVDWMVRGTLEGNHPMAAALRARD
jgi:hypothetical protein